ncbi:MAG: lytic transglycosylase domain-containing protein [Acidobacteria bacterium]|nr:lytic transglycosylase domain-containing protein [Acidobacteriota bacterium]
MKPSIWKICAGAAALGLLLVPVSGFSSSSELAWRPAPPDANHVAALEDLSSWLGQAESASKSASLRLPQGLRQAIKRRSESFELLRAYNGEEAAKKRLAEMPYGDAIYRAAAKNGVDALLLASLVEVESNFSPRVISPKGAVGLAQVLPSTAGYDPTELSKPAVNLDLGAAYLKTLLDRFDGDLELALAAYNAGPYAVQRFDGVPPFRETKRYVEKVLAIYVAHCQDLWQSSATTDLLIN